MNAISNPSTPATEGIIRRRFLDMILILASLLFLHAYAWGITDGQSDTGNRFGNVVRVRVRAGEILSGILIEPDVVLTSAHGLVAKDGNPVAPESVLIEQANGGTFQNSRAKTLIMNPEYLNGKDEESDIAVILLKQPLRMRQSVLLLPSEGWNEQLLQDMLERNGHDFKGVIAGFGSTVPCDHGGNGCKNPETLVIGEVRVLPAWVCKGSHLNFSNMGRLIDRMFCAQSKSRTAPGDSGGPLFLKMKNGSLLLVGLTANTPIEKWTGQFSDRFTAIHSGLVELESRLPKPINVPRVVCSVDTCGIK